ncbi:MAG: Uncharacterised protein [Flavobacteriia bacterium]|nr:MAG: Uncharacterised protein [Flavobacteriia bacterium]
MTIVKGPVVVAAVDPSSEITSNIVSLQAKSELRLPTKSLVVVGDLTDELIKIAAPWMGQFLIVMSVIGQDPFVRVDIGLAHIEFKTTEEVLDIEHIKGFGPDLQGVFIGPGSIARGEVAGHEFIQHELHVQLPSIPDQVGGRETQKRIARIRTPGKFNGAIKDDGIQEIDIEPTAVG